MYKLAQMPVSLAKWSGVKVVRPELIQVLAGLERFRE